MKLTLELACDSSQEWIDTVMGDFNTFLQDHADCERKASAMSMSFIAKYPNRTEIIPELMEIAIEELEHFQQVYALMEKRGIRLPDKMTEDPYVKKLIKLCRDGRDDRFLDRLMIASLVETRGAERFRMVAERQTDPELKRFYTILFASEAKHGNVFIKMAKNYFEDDHIYSRLDYFMEHEGKIISALNIRPALH